MTPVRPDVRAFFRRYERAAADLDSEALTSSFWDVFLSLDASSAAVVSHEALLAALPRRKQLFEAIGSDGLELTDISEMPLDDLHTLVRTSWHLRMRNQALRDPVYLLSTFILRQDDGAWRIVLYLNHQDMTKLFSNVAVTQRAHPGLTISEAGDISAIDVQNQMVTSNLHRVGLLAIPVTLLVLLLAVVSLVTALVPLLLGLTALAAGLGLVCVVALFGTLASLDLKQAGAGLTVAVLIDATVIRSVLLPAAMTVLGEQNWYLPRWLAWLSRLGLEPPGVLHLDRTGMIGI
jgi:MMPL family